MKAQIEIIDSKICKGCKKELSLNNFWKQPNNKDGYFGKCKICALLLVDNNIVNRQPFIEKNIWICSSCKKELLLNKENFHLAANSITGFRNKCKECIKKDRISFDRIVNKDSLDYFLKEVLSSARCRAVKKKLEFNISLEYLKSLWNKQRGKCSITGLDMTHIILNGKMRTSLSIDRIDSNKGYTVDNVQLVCIVANMMKNNMTLNELKYFCNLIVQNNE